MNFNRIAATVFTIVALAHAWRAVQQLPMQLGTTAVPLWISVAGAIGAGLLAIWGFRARG